MTKETDEQFLKAMENNRHRNGGGLRLRKLIAKRDKAQYGSVACYCCGYPVSHKSGTIEHVLPRSVGGKTVMENLALSHPICNAERGATIIPKAPILFISI